jgi:hypothetical protein
MEKFIFEKSAKQREEMISYAHSDEFLNASIEEIKEFLAIFTKYFPQIASETDPERAKWRAAHAHIISILNGKETRKTNKKSIAVQIWILIILLLTLLFQISSTLITCGTKLEQQHKAQTKDIP